MDRGIPTEKVLEQMFRAQPPVQYLVGTPRGRLSQYEQRLAGLPWQVAREGVKVKLLSGDQELYVLAESHDRVNKERAVRRRQLKGLWPIFYSMEGGLLFSEVFGAPPRPVGTTFPAPAILLSRHFTQRRRQGHSRRRARLVRLPQQLAA